VGEVMAGKRFTAGGEDWEQQLLEQLSTMFQDMGMNIDVNALKGMMEQIRVQLEQAGIDPEQLKKGDNIEPNLQATLNNLAKTIQGELTKAARKSTPPVEVEASEEEQEADEVHEIPEADVYVDDGRMNLTLDISRYLTDESVAVELNLTKEGTCLNLMAEGRPHPLRRFQLARACSDVVEWDMNNGILDVTLELLEE
jgi:HSP20 family molecular chaperone IbpA